MVGTLFALAGVALASRAPLQSSVPPGYLLALVGSVLCLAQAAVLVRRLPAVHPVTMNALGMAAASVVLFAGSLVADDHWTLPERATTGGRWAIWWSGAQC